MEALASLAANKLFLGCAILVMNVGSRFVIMDVGRVHEKLLNNQVVKKVVIFCMFFVATRDIMTALILTFAFIILLEGLLNEHSRFSVLPRMFKSNVAAAAASSNIPSAAQYQDALATIEKYKAALHKA